MMNTIYKMNTICNKNKYDLQDDHNFTGKRCHLQENFYKLQEHECNRQEHEYNLQEHEYNRQEHEYNFQNDKENFQYC